ncbi:MAG: GNAT family N-acetyltransferase [Rhodocyclales bacterium]|nr:GNAT family N-acetyltransferase [Rhodocyclales bacterium]
MTPTRTGSGGAIREAVFPQDTERLVALIREYVAWLDMDLSYRGFDAEMAAFERLFTLPSGMFFLAEAGGELAGCAGLLRHSAAEAEVKRLYVRPRFRGHALGERLVAAVVGQAAALGCRRLILDAVPQTTFAQRLYERLGFTETPPYYDQPVPGTRFFALALDGAGSQG